MDDFAELFKELGKYSEDILKEWEDITAKLTPAEKETRRINELFKEMGGHAGDILKEWESIEDVIDATAGSAASRADAEKRVLEQLEEQRYELDRIAALTNPDIIEKKLKLEKEITEAKKGQAEAELKAQVGGAGGALGYAGSQLKDKLPTLLRAAGGGNALKSLGYYGGEALGTAFGGPVGGAIGGQVGEMVGDQIPKALGAPMTGLAEGFKNIATVLQGLSGTLGPIGAGFDMMSGAAHKLADGVKSIPIIGELLGPMMDAMAAIPDTIKQITEALVGMAAKASPSAFKQFQYAVEDVQGVIGQSFLPVLDLMRDGIRLVGDTLASILPSSNEVYAALGPLQQAFSGLGDSLRELMTEIGPLIRDELILGLQMFAGALEEIISVGKMAADALGFVLKPLRAIMGFLGVDTSSRSSVGAAYRGQAQFSGFEDYEKKLQESAFSEPGRPKMDELPNTVINIRDLLQQMVNWTLILTPGGIAMALKDVMTDLFSGGGGGEKFSNPRSANDALLDFLKLNPWLRPGL
jgi:hypothetical protein